MAEQQLSLFKGTKRLSFNLSSGPNIGEQLYDRSLLVLIVGLILFGFVMVSSASVQEAISLGKSQYYFIERHAFYLLVAALTAWIVLRVEVETWLKGSILIYGLGLLGLILIYTPLGIEVNGSTRWLGAGVARVQVSEFAKLCLIIYVSSFIARHLEQIRIVKFGFLKPIAAWLLFAALVFNQPDLGSVVVLFMITLGLLFLAGSSMSVFLSLSGAGLLLFSYAAIFEEYRLRRLMSFLDPWQDPLGDGYQLTHSLMAYGRGDWFGQGLGNSIQKLEYLPEAHTDFIFSIIGEELGFVGVVIVLALLFYLMAKAFLIGKKCILVEQAFAGYVSWGIAIWVGFQTTVNLGMGIGLLPTKGLTLPFISYGGSSLVAMTMAGALLIRIDFEYRLSQQKQLKIKDE
ncbi:putative lipid II flippase FtsW [Paraferrimonas sp. SM1919]|uniref:putative lipid II flippase FtsW n=1 Tax=Paraferrimonas sp. SM1919 TaxID=2662263 RepID=UPI0013D1E1AE|nr:putative lipid II flippase FtsW [Paraferrimonas sp. SM1919]